MSEGEEWDERKRVRVDTGRMILFIITFYIRYGKDSVFISVTRLYIDLFCCKAAASTYIDNNNTVRVCICHSRHFAHSHDERDNSSLRRRSSAGTAAVTGGSEGQLQ